VFTLRILKRVGFRAIAAAALFVAAISSYAEQERKGPEQPIPYSHKQHLALGLACKDCHSNAAPGDAMSFPVSSKCMSCHQTIKKDSPAIQKLATFDHNKQEIPWVRVYKVPDFVFFSHKAHLDAGAKCDDCHGQVAQRDRLFRETDLSMAGCASCHRERNASQTCDYCHEAR
jgi:Cytochrome c7 and related cytochrome c/Cytochrome c3